MKIFVVLASLLLTSLNANASAGSWKKHWDPFIGMQFNQFYSMWNDASGVWGWDPYAWEVKTSNSWLNSIYPNMGFDWLNKVNSNEYLSDTLIIKIQAEPQIYYFKFSDEKLFKIDTGQYMMAKRKEEIDLKNAELAEKKKQDKLRAQIETEAMKENEIAQRKIRMQNLKSDCEELGFKDGTEAMGNCVLKLMELQGNNSPTVVTTTTSNSSQEIVDIEKQKLQAQREALKLQQDQLKAEQERVAQERRKAIQRNANKSIRQGQCLMNGGSTWDCM